MKDKNNPMYQSKCHAMTLYFDNISVDVSEIIFKNYYTYEISVLVLKIFPKDPFEEEEWDIAIPKKVL